MESVTFAVHTGYVRADTLSIPVFASIGRRVGHFRPSRTPYEPQRSVHAVRWKRIMGRVPMQFILRHKLNAHAPIP